MPYWKTILLPAGFTFALATSLAGFFTGPVKFHLQRPVAHDVSTFRFLSPPSDTTIAGVVNSYTPVLSFSNCDSSLLQVGSAAAFSPGDKVL